MNVYDVPSGKQYKNWDGFGNLSVSMKVFQKLRNIKYTQQQEDVYLSSRLRENDVHPEHVFSHSYSWRSHCRSAITFSRLSRLLWKE